MSTISAANSTLSSSYYLGKYYSDNRKAKTDSNRKTFSNDSLISYDSSALKKFIKDIKNTKTTTKDSETNLKNKVSAFVSLYNNFVSSTAKSTDHSTLQRSTKIKKLTSAQKKELEKMGITIGKDSKMTLDTDTLEKVDIDKVKSMFSNDSSYIKAISSCASKINITV